MTNEQKKRIIRLLRQEIVPAIGCTEPIAVSLCTAKAVEILGFFPEKIIARLSANIIKNAMGVVIPGTKEQGLPVAIALGALSGNPAYGLEVLKDVTPESVLSAKKLIDAGVVCIELKEQISEKLYIEVECMCGGESSCAVIASSHTHFVYLSKNNDILLDLEHSPVITQTAEPVLLNMKVIYDFSVSVPLDEVCFILETERINMEAAEYALRDDYGHRVGKALTMDPGRKIVGDSILTKVMSYTAAACDARMGGAQVTIMSNSGSGNHGIAATIPVAVFARENGNTRDELQRALLMSHLTAIYIKQSLGRLSAVCGCAVASIGSGCGITYLMGGDYEKVTYTVKNMVANLTGMICDGAKPGCSMKLTSGASTAVFSALVAMQGHTVMPCEGITDHDVDQCIRNLSIIGTRGMSETDSCIFDMMFRKNKS
ncbi:MAG: L-serine ammonia-lyase, iron-sulfur-dependent, subunit alpha [Bacteroidales bacterium]|jgi:L-cysteine desulfidase|nr:L-serine ammonia-lyase, iron-sulfur-dependent, subunit alpha [Bacteroidales bacterium]MDD2264534.1 L-serine ammonia-lyase, iron-sulfur-dependent, subunit alpha [Bacteroidales bacterium]MDD3209413.1 L-serine ammonia-lyase, iron-sulfur-dependent, subunit alpha [Bacteroidales bacterium]MDD3697781.1 L-serine ammonia-lyase, iron-sulfur-dependent, subunit alpha [Bacteroidales bacterium]MDD4168110.1 L-serine ammonia-lyase, iron-sulfur-dependent, subunit alpha [Bacteroidales bacterium]